jgi:hypothetical protein
MAEELVNVPQDLTLVSDEDLTDLETRATSEYDRVRNGDVSPDDLQYVMRLSNDIDRLRLEKATRAERAKQAAEQEKAKVAAQLESLDQRVHGQKPEPISGESGISQDALDAMSRATAEGIAAGLSQFLSPPGRGADAVSAASRASATLTEARKHVPVAPSGPRQRLVVTAGVDIPGVERGGELVTLDSLVDAYHKRAKNLPITQGSPRPEIVATVRQEFAHTIDDRTSPAEVGELFRFLTTQEQKESLVAGGGWCAPSQIKYDFFNIACEDGLIDLPTFGVSRGGIRFPVSPSLADAIGSNAFAPFAVAFSNTSVPFLWTEADDQATVTGSVNKPVMRVPCPTFSEQRLECYGVNLTAGNLTDDAYPEATQNTIRLLMAAHSHAMNSRIIALMVAASSAIVTGGDFATATGDPVTQILGGIELATVDYRARYGMCQEDVLEVVLPYWVRDVLRSGFRHRQGFADAVSAADGEIASWFADLQVRPQFVGDWQIRGSGQFGSATAVTAWPATVDIMVYAAGTFLLGNGLTLDLGVVRDSVLNAENDFTAAWSEECHLVARVGHESRQYRIQYNVGITTATTAPSSPPLL